MDSLSLERRLLNEFVESNYHFHSILTTFDIDSIIREASNRDFLFSSWMLAYQKALGIEGGKVTDLGFIVDLIVYAADILDDLQDGATAIKDGKQLNEAIFILVFSIHAVQQMALPSVVHARISTILTENLMLALMGQQLDLTNQSNSSEDYFLMVEKKAGTFFKLASDLVMSVLEEPIDSDLLKETTKLSNSLGIYNQILNDIEDFMDLGEDIKNRRRTLPVIYTLNDKNSLLAQYYLGTCTYEQLKEKKHAVINENQTSGVIPYCHYYLLFYENEFNKIIENSIFFKSNADLFISFIKRRSSNGNDYPLYRK